MNFIMTIKNIVFATFIGLSLNATPEAQPAPTIASRIKSFGSHYVAPCTVFLMSTGMARLGLVNIRTLMRNRYYSNRSDQIVALIAVLAGLHITTEIMPHLWAKAEKTEPSSKHADLSSETDQ